MEYATGTIPPIATPYDIDTFTLANLTADVTVALNVEGKTLLSETLTPDDSGAVALYGLAQLVMDYLETLEPRLFNYTFTVNGEEEQIGKVFYYRHRATQFIGENIDRYFLTLAANELKTIPPVAEETLHFVPTEDETTNKPSAKVVCLWYSPYTCECVESETTAAADYTAATGFAAIVVRPSDFTPPTSKHRLLTITVTLGTRQIMYRLQSDDQNGAPVTRLKFRNAYNLWDTFYFFGHVQETNKPTISAASINGKYCNYRIKHEPTFTAVTGEMSKASALLFRDLISAKEIARIALSDDNITQWEYSAVITECDFKPSNAYASSGTGTLTWKETQSGLHLSPTLPARTFDHTFDQTFN